MSKRIDFDFGKLIDGDTDLLGYLRTGDGEYTLVERLAVAPAWTAMLDRVTIGGVEGMSASEFSEVESAFKEALAEAFERGWPMTKRILATEQKYRRRHDARPD